MDNKPVAIVNECTYFDHGYHLDDLVTIKSVKFLTDLEVGTELYLKTEKQLSPNESMRQQAGAWGKVTELLSELVPNWFLLGPTEEECALRAIRELAQQKVKNIDVEPAYFLHRHEEGGVVGTEHRETSEQLRECGWSVEPLYREQKGEKE